MIIFKNNAKVIIYKQAAALPFRYKNDSLEIMLITSRKNKKWIIPKGLMEDGLTQYELALKEAYEEAGIAGQITTQSQGEYQYEKWGGLCTVNVFSLHVNTIFEHWPEDDFRSRDWFTPKEALEKVGNRDLKQILAQFIESQKKLVIYGP